MDNVFQLDNEYIAHTYARFPLEIVCGKGSLLYGRDGKEYIDFGSGIAVNSFGTADEKWIDAVIKQINCFSHTSNLFYSEPCVRLAEMLCTRTGMKRVFFSNSGAEANECAIKAARKYSEDKGNPGAPIITLVNSFHGRTITTLAATGQDVFHESFLPLTEGFEHIPANDYEALEKLVLKCSPCAVMLEIVQGEGGVCSLTKEFVKKTAALAKKKGFLIICDEVQTGNGRSGMLYAYMNYGIVPDIVTTAKGLGGGLPLGATLLGEKVADVYTPGSHGSTFGGNPVCCAGAISILSRIDDEFLNEVKKKSEYIINTLRDSDGIKGITGMGLMLGIETERSAKDVLNECRENGVLVLTAKSKIRLLPPLNIPMELLEKAVLVIKAVCAKKI